MPRELYGWLKDVVEHALRRPVIKMYRDRPRYSIIESIQRKQSLGLNPIIAEYKRRSPSGLYVVRDLYDYLSLMEKYATGISILTEDKYFGGSYEILREASRILRLPILMKDFIVCEHQIETAYNIGADTILLILSILTEEEAEKLYRYAKSFGLEVIVEVNTVDEAVLAMEMGVEIIGINSRNLKTLEIDMDRTCEIMKNISSNTIKIAESGIKSRSDIEKLKICGANAFLIGTSLMKNPKNILEYI
ncbi:Indole-3-glycerol-phosphate synthase [Ignisphaera aggregans DSM 17230]|uniref:Indole-3-glycerol phosphate synthase n=1 Tax=Ignisphaera aggregans (strain DSM 17230 / JCM 13409 / AQ1.S1) TaxID=583356 RepID=E0SS62_IGNAA|nr:Indole-3-glycerol-phosphate synthase [Ignisphaera aggregans DSM 17230]